MHDETRGRDPLEYAAIGQYQTRGILGRGAMGTVYEGLHPALGKRVAIKRVRLPEAHDAEAQETLLRFRREAEAAARLDHPNIVGVFDYGETDNSAFIVMEFIDGTNLSQVLTQAEPMPLSEAVQVMQDILAGLAYSHARGVVHRDIKPANIMITSDKRAKIADFGIARLDGGAGLTLTGAMLGTPAYMSPEQFTGPAADHRTDIYSAGVVFYQMLTGERPFAGGSLMMMHYNVLNTTPPPPSNLAATVPAGLDDVVKRAMARRRDDRFASAAEFTQAITEALRPKRPIPPAALDPQATLVLPQPLPHFHKPDAPSGPDRRGIQPKTIAAICVLLLVSGSVIAWYTLTQPAGQPSKSASTAPPAATLVKEVANPSPNPLPPGSPQEQQQSPSDASICSASVALQGLHPILDPSRAGPACEAALRQKPNDPQLSVLMANVRRFQQNNAAEAARLYRVAAEQGNAAGQNSLGFLYAKGLGGLPRDERQAARLFRLAADQGNASAQYNLAFYYEQGLGGLPRNPAEAARLYRLAAEQGNASAQYNLGFYYDQGLGGLPKDKAKAAGFYRLAADQGFFVDKYALAD